MFETMKNAWKIPDLRKKIFFTLMMIVVYRFGAVIPVPFIDTDKIAEIFKGGAGILDFFDLMAGGSFKNFTIFALNIYPYITASIVLQLLAIVFPRLEEIFKREDGRKKMGQYTRYLTVVLALIQAVAYSVGIFKSAVTGVGYIAVPIIVLVLTAGTAFLMWLGEMITDKGIGNGISIIIFAGIISRFPIDMRNIFVAIQGKTASVYELIIFLIFAVIIVIGVIATQMAERKVPVHYAKKVVGRKMYGGQSTHIPMKVLMAGVMPVIFASTFTQIPQTLGFFVPKWKPFVDHWFAVSGNGGPGVWIYSIFSILLIIFFTYFYTAVQFNPVEYATNLKDNGGFIPGIRPGRPTSDYLSKVLNRVTIVGAVTLAIIATIPTFVMTFTNLKVYFGGTSLLIVVGVALETMKQLEAHMVMRHYKGFLK